jgi:hypothetical protein
VKARDVVGRKIVAVDQNRFWDERAGGWIFEVRALVLDNGARVYPSVVELECDYAVEMYVTRPVREDES